VTPLIDVLLVLLIIFLVMMPIMLRSETVALPPSLPEPSETVAVELKLAADFTVALDDGPAFPGHELAAQLRSKVGKAGAVFVDSAGGVPWDQVISTIDTVRGVANSLDRADLTVAVRLHND